MSKSNAKTDSQELAGMVELARLGVATAESRWKASKERARVAKRRRKEARLNARRARKEAQQAKANLAEAREALAKAEAKLARPGSRTVTTRPPRKPVKKTAAAPQKKSYPVHSPSCFKICKTGKPHARSAATWITCQVEGCKIAATPHCAAGPGSASCHSIQARPRGTARWWNESEPAR